MKYQQLFFIIVLVTACSGTKRVVENTQKEKTEKMITKDSIIENKIVENIKSTISEPETNESSIICHATQPIKGSIQKTNHKSFDKLLNKYVSNKGLIDYLAFKNSYLDLQFYITHLGEMTPTDKWTKEDKLAYWINAYNAMTIDLILQNYPIKSIKDIKDPWGERLWKLGNKWYNLNDIEHEILRKMDEPRIHFAIVCASYSCPKLQNKAFYAENLKEQLTNATKEFLSDSERNEIYENDLKLSKIFQWFTKDFKQNGSLIDFLNTYSEIQISEKAKISYKDYNWDLNE